VSNKWTDGNPFVVAGEAYGALAAYAVGVITNNQALQDAATAGMRENVNIQAAMALAMTGRSGRSAKVEGPGPKGTKDFDAARREAFERAGMTDPSKITFSRVDPKTGTVVEFKGEGGAKVGYDAAHGSTGPYHGEPHVSWQTAGKVRDGGRQRGNIPYSGEQHPSRTREQ
jgi:hypothetical protein